jgi:DNA phosphorothioation-dependent restriction protein DptG
VTHEDVLMFERFYQAPARRRATSKLTNIYFVRAGENGPIKIGVAQDVQKRLRAIRVHNHEELMLLTSAWVEASEERRLHRLLAAHRIRGEWFAPAPEVLFQVEAFRLLEENS